MRQLSNASLLARIFETVPYATFMSSPHRTRAIAALCQELTAAAVVFPGTRLRLVYAIAGADEGPKRTV